MMQSLVIDNKQNTVFFFNEPGRFLPYFHSESKFGSASKTIDFKIVRFFCIIPNFDRDKKA